MWQEFAEPVFAGPMSILDLPPDVMSVIARLTRTHGTLFCNSSAACSVGRLRGSCRTLWGSVQLGWSQLLLERDHVRQKNERADKKYSIDRAIAEITKSRKVVPCAELPGAVAQRLAGRVQHVYDHEPMHQLIMERIDDRVRREYLEQRAGEQLYRYLA